MAIASSLSFTASAGATTISGISCSASGNNNVDISVVVPASTTDQLYTIAIDVSEVQSLFLNATGVMTLETNATDHTGGQIFTFAASNPLVWNTGMPVVCPLTIDVTKFYLTNATASDITLTGYILQDL